MGPDGPATPRGQLVPRLLRWTPAAAALVAATLLTVNCSIRPRADRTPELDPPSDIYVAVRQRTDQKLEIVAELVAGRMTTTEAHARFLDINRADTRGLMYLRTRLPGETDEERTAYQLVLFIQVFRHPRAAEVGATVSRELLGREPSPGHPTAWDRKHVPVPE
jgi:hypothetical protein